MTIKDEMLTVAEIMHLALKLGCTHTKFSDYIGKSCNKCEILRLLRKELDELATTRQELHVSQEINP